MRSKPSKVARERETVTQARGSGTETDGKTGTDETDILRGRDKQRGGGEYVGRRGECKYDDIAVPYTVLPSSVQYCSAAVQCSSWVQIS